MPSKNSRMEEPLGYSHVSRLTSSGLRKKFMPKKERIRMKRRQSFSYTPLSRFSITVNPAFFASETERGASILGILTELIFFRIGFLQYMQRASGSRSAGRISSNPLRHMRHERAGSSGFSEMYSYIGIDEAWATPTRIAHARKIVKEIRCYQLDFVTPGIMPALASSRKAIRERWKRRRNAWRRPVSSQRLTSRTGDALRGNIVSPM